MKTIATEERYEQHGSPMFWIWMFIGAMWVLQAVLRMSDGESGIGMVCCWICVAASFLNTWLWSGYRLIVDEKGIELKEIHKVRSIAWSEIGRVTVHNKVSFVKSTGLTFHMADENAKSLYLNKKDELLPLVKRYTELPIEEAT